MSDAPSGVSSGKSLDDTAFFTNCADAFRLAGDSN
jgi:hypothetical protein